MKFYTTEQLGPKQSVTPEGFLLCEEVSINRTGEMIYGPGETPIPVGPDGIARIEREEQEVFRPETIASFAGKPVVNEHPDVDVDPDNWNELAVGVVLNVRRGAGALDDTLLADLMLTNREAIKDVRAGKREVSCGYDADYLEIGPGRGRQTNIVGNHVALVDSGRCGPRCAIGDSKTSTKEERMTWLEKLKAAVNKGDTKAAAAVIDEINEAAVVAGNGNGNSPPVVVNVSTQDAKKKTKDTCDDDDDDDKKKKARDDDDDDDDKRRKRAKDDDDDDDKKRKARDAAFDRRLSRVEDALDAQAKDLKAIKDAVMRDADDPDDDDDDDDKKAKDAEPPFEAEAPPGTGDHARATDSAFMQDSFQESVALGEIIAPGVSIPTFDAKAKPKRTYDTLCQFRRRVLDVAYHSQPDSRSFMDDILQGRTMDSLKCERVRDVFLAVGNFKKRANNSDFRGNRTGDGVGGGTGVRGEIRTPADLNKRLAEFYKQ